MPVNITRSDHRCLSVAIGLIVLWFPLAVWAQTAGPRLETFTNSIGMHFVRIPAGSFLMGSPSDEPGRHLTEVLHRVTIRDPFYLQSTEVTQAQWVAVMGSNPSEFEGGNQPVERVSWEDARAFIDQLNTREGVDRYRLPTESEWEYAARAGGTEAFCYGGDAEDLGAYGWYRLNSGGRTHAVAGKLPNRWGLYDIHGNVWEWVQDWYGRYPVAVVADPGGPSSGVVRVRRGCGWMSSVQSCRLASRSANEPDHRIFAIGLRLARDIR